MGRGLPAPKPPLALTFGFSNTKEGFTSAVQRVILLALSSPRRASRLLLRILTKYRERPEI